MESDTPIDLLASRVWSGSKWHYPHIEAMLSDIERLRAELAAHVNENESLGKQQGEFIETIVKLEKQRDEARQEVCWFTAKEIVVHNARQFIQEPIPTPEEIALERGWDCLKEGGGADA